MTSVHVMRLHSVQKSFGGSTALEGVDLEVAGGTVHALLGGNGSGKSTLIKTLAGVYAADSGSLGVRGRVHDLGSSWSPADAMAAGFRFVHQDAGLFPAFTVAENMCAGVGWSTVGPQVRWTAVHARAREALSELGIELSTRHKVGSLPKAQQTMVAMARALTSLDEEGEPGLLVLDEPSATLPDHDMHTLMDLVRRVAERGHGVLYVSHRLEEILAIADHITVLRDGRVVGGTPRSATTKAGLLEMIVGRPAEEVFTAGGHARTGGSTVLSVREVATSPLHEVSFEVTAGEVLGVAGLAGAGCSELLEAIFGRRAATGRVGVDGNDVALGSVGSAAAAGIAFVPADRLGAGIFPSMSIIDNVSVGSLSSFYLAGRIARRKLRRDAEVELDRHRVRRVDDDAPISSLSGGNQQKVVLARALRRRPRVLLLDDPTQGVDVGAKADIWNLIRSLTEQGSCVVVHSTDYEELVDVADRILVLGGGGVVALRSAAQLDRQRLTELTYQQDRPKQG